MGDAERRWRLDGGGGARVVVMGIESPRFSTVTILHNIFES